MVDAPEKIWIDQDDCPYFYEESELAEAGSPVTEYIRADLCHPPALEPSAARELALEEILREVDEVERKVWAWSGSAFLNNELEGAEDADCKTELYSELCRIGNAMHWLRTKICALSSPDHADAGKVEGDGWHVEYEVYSEDEWQAASTDLDGALDYAVMYAADGFKNITVQEVRRRTLPSTPSEGAE